MNTFLVNKDDFIEIIDELQKSNDYQNDLNKIFRKYDLDGFLFQPDCSCSAVKLLHLIFGKADEDNWISYFCFELDFGREWKPGTITNNGADVKLQTAEDLYNLLLNN